MSLDPSVYEPWRASLLGQMTEARERDLILDLIGPPAGLHILDVGCGDGDLALDLGQRGARVIGVDSSAAMIKAARRHARSGANGEISFEHANARALPFPPATFDRVVAVTLLCFVEDAPAVVREMARVLKPGGELVIGELGKWSLWAATRRLRGWMGEEIWARARFHTPKQLQKLVRRADLTAGPVAGAVYYPPWEWAARLLAPKEQEWSRLTHIGAAFLALSARKRGGQP